MTIYFNPFVRIAPPIRESDLQEQDERRRTKAHERQKAQQRQVLLRQQGDARRDAMRHALAVAARREPTSLPSTIDLDERRLDDDRRDVDQATEPAHAPPVTPTAQRREATRPRIDLIAPYLWAESAPSDGDREFIDAFFTDAPADDDERQRLSSSLDAARPHVCLETPSPRGPRLPHGPQVPDALHAAEVAELASVNVPALPVETPQAGARSETARRTVPLEGRQSLGPPSAAKEPASDDAAACGDDAGLAFLEAFCADSLASNEDLQQLSAALDQLDGAVGASAGPSPAIQAAVLAHHVNALNRTPGSPVAATSTRGDIASIGKSGRIADIEETLIRACAALSDQDDKKALLKKFIEERRIRAGAGDQDSSGAMQADAEMVEGQQAAIQSRQAATTLALETVRNV